MNREAERELGKAEKALTQGEKFYRKAAEHIVRAIEADSKLSYEKIGKRLGHSGGWVKRVLAWASSDSELPTPFTGDSPGVAARHAKQILRDAPLETVEQIITTLPKERQTAIMAGLGSSAARARQEYDERERTMSPAQRKEREATAETVEQKAAEMLAGFDRLAIVNDLEHATELLNAMIAKSVVTSELLTSIDAALAEFLDAYRVAQAKVEEGVRT